MFSLNNLGSLGLREEEKVDQLSARKNSIVFYYSGLAIEENFNVWIFGALPEPLESLFLNEVKTDERWQRRV